MLIDLPRLYPAIVGVFIQIDVNVFLAPLHAPPIDLELDTSNAKLMVFRTSGHTCKSVEC